MEQLLERFVAWAETCLDIRGAIVVGSQARTDHPADEWSDVDIVVITTDPKHYLSTTDWLENIGKPWITFLEGTAVGNELERRVLFEGGFDVDFVFLSKEGIQQAIQDSQILGVFRDGMRVVLDKDRELAQLQLILSSAEFPLPHPPMQSEFLEVINDFWYHAVWTAKKLRRGELWVAKSCCDFYMKRLLLKMIEWQTRAIKGWNYNTWHRGRFLEEWAEPRVLERLKDVFAHYNKDDIKRALMATMDMFRGLAIETSERLGYDYPKLADGCATEWIKVCLKE